MLRRDNRNKVYALPDLTTTSAFPPPQGVLPPPGQQRLTAGGEFRARLTATRVEADQLSKERVREIMRAVRNFGVNSSLRINRVHPGPH